MSHISFSTSVNPHPRKGELTVLFSGHAQTASAHAVGPQVLDYYLVHTVIAGCGLYVCRGREYRLSAGDSFFIFPGELVRYDADAKAPWRYRWIGFRGTEAERLLHEAGVSADRPIVASRRPRRTAALYHRVQAVLDEGGPACDWEAGGYFRLLLGSYARDGEAAAAPQPSAPAESGAEQIDRAIRWLTLQYSQPISIDMIARQLGYHRTHLSKLFKQHTGLAPMSFLLKVRMERAKLLLQEPLTIEQVASSVGFADPLYFSKQFRKYYGKSPSEYRSGLRDGDWFDCERT